MTRTVTAAACLLLAASSALAAPLPKGAKAPKITGEKWVQKGKDVKALTPEALKGKVVVLEFWAFW